jgi:hypothetical protein
MKSNQERETVGLELGVCQIKVGDKIAADPGQSATEPKAGLTRRGIVNPVHSRVPRHVHEARFQDRASVRDEPEREELLMLPLITPWTKGGGSVTVVGFIWFAVTKNDRRPRGGHRRRPSRRGLGRDDVQHDRMLDGSIHGGLAGRQADQAHPLNGPLRGKTAEARAVVRARVNGERGRSLCRRGTSRGISRPGVPLNHAVLPEPLRCRELRSVR